MLGKASTQKYDYCRNFAGLGNIQQTIMLPSHGRGRWFEPSIAHSKKVSFAGKVLACGVDFEQSLDPRAATVQQRG